MGKGKYKRWRGKVKGGQPSHHTPRTQSGIAAKEMGERKVDGNTATIPLEGEGMAGDEPGYTPNP